MIEGLNSVAVLAVIAVLFFLFRPHIRTTVARRSSIPETVRVGYVIHREGVRRGRFVELISDDSDPGDPAAATLVTTTVEGIPGPEKVLGHPGNRFLLTGYRMELEKRNLINGKTKRVPSNRFEIESWEVIPPYSVYVAVGGEMRTFVRDAPVRYPR